MAKMKKDSKEIFYTDNMVNIVKSMNNIVVALNDERAYYEMWIHHVPDEATEEDFKDIAEDQELLDDTIDCFARIVENYIK